ncbi:hypothetical protein [Rhodohalobacter sp.]|uniref:hypothetical protein n=1 Tax=Rhodohalobacter sp. TaxID=1974210 RepID=UPI002ACD9A6B|nr:hypothetical protein [Rhodohalobacter sp.]MDZ7756049.1 hypothetical protein [Rhodohalobacter sp.]
MGYRLGIAEEIPISQLIQQSPSGSSVEIPEENNTYSDKISVGTKLSLFSNLSVDLNWRTEWDERVTNNISLTPDGEFTFNRTVQREYWIFGLLGFWLRLWGSF